MKAVYGDKQPLRCPLASLPTSRQRLPEPRAHRTGETPSSGGPAISVSSAGAITIASSEAERLAQELVNRKAQALKEKHELEEQELEVKAEKVRLNEKQKDERAKMEIKNLEELLSRSSHVSQRTRLVKASSMSAQSRCLMILKHIVCTKVETKQNRTCYFNLNNRKNRAM